MTPNQYSRWFFFGLLPLVLQMSALSQVRITEVTISTKNVEVTNFGSTSVNLSTWWFCHRFTYPALSGTIAPGESKQFTVNFNQISSDLGLYTSTSFGSTAAMEDFVEWGGADIGRSSVAVSKGIWSATAFLTVPPAGASLHAKGNPGVGVRQTNWFKAFPHAGFPLPPIKILSTNKVGNEMRVTASSYYLLADHRVDTSTSLTAGAWLTSTPTTVTDLGGKMLDIRFPSGGNRLFARLKSLP